MLKNIIYGLITVLFISNCSSDDDAMPDLLQSNCDTFANQVFVEENGLLVIEVENTEIGNQWEVLNEIPDFTGNSYIRWGGEDLFGTPGEGYMSYNIRINTPGTYRFQWRCRIAKGNDHTEHNDAWLRMPDADDFFGEKGNGNRVYPKGTGKSPTPEGGGKDGWFKVFVNQLDKWVWGGRTSDNDGHDIFATFDTAGDYTIEISGRSSGFAIDRMVLYWVSGDSSITGNEATDDAQAESSVVCN